MKKDRKNDILDEAIHVIRLLSGSGVSWALTGGVAVGIHGFIRATEDVDVVINPSDLEKIDGVLKENGFIINRESIDFKNGFKIFRRVKITGDEYFVLDILVPPAEYLYILDNRIEGYIDNTAVYVISKEDLIEIKKRSGRKIDMIDIEELEKGHG